MSRKGSRKSTGRSEATTSAKSPVTLRLGDLESEVEGRAAGAALGSVVRRDLARYYRILRDYEISGGMSVDNSDAVVHALRDFDEAAYQYIWAAVDELLSSRDALMESMELRDRFWRVDREDLILTLRMNMHDQGRKMAILDAVERYWNILRAAGVEPPRGWAGLPNGYDAEYPVTDPEIDALVEVGLTGPGYAKRYRKERDDPARTKDQPPQESAAAEYVRDAQQAAGERIRKFSRASDV